MGMRTGNLFIVRTLMRFVDISDEFLDESLSRLLQYFACLIRCWLGVTQVYYCVNVRGGYNGDEMNDVHLDFHFGLD